MEQVQTQMDQAAGIEAQHLAGPYRICAAKFSMLCVWDPLFAFTPVLELL